MKIKVYQINLGKDEKRVAFMGLNELKSLSGTGGINSSIYDCVFSGDVKCKSLEDIFQKFNATHPDDYKGRSLSVSDIVEVINSADIEKGFYYCDSIGFKRVSFDASKSKPYEKKKIRVLMVEPGKKAYEKEIGTNLEDFYAEIGCECIQATYPYSDMVAIVCDDEGKLNNSRPNRAIYDEKGNMLDIIFGSFFICDCSTSEFASLPDDIMEKYKEKFLLPERFCKVEDAIIGIKYEPTT